MAALNAEIPGDLKTAVDHAVVDRKTTVKAAVIEALTAWLRGSVPKTEQTLTCPACESTLSVDPGLSGKVMVLRISPKLEQTQKSNLSVVEFDPQILQIGRAALRALRNRPVAAQALIDGLTDLAGPDDSEIPGQEDVRGTNPSGKGGRKPDRGIAGHHKKTG
jgi:hypothetical protein